VLVTHPPYPTGTLSSAGSALTSHLLLAQLSYCLSGSAHSYRLSGLTTAIASRAQLSPLGLSYRLSGSAITSRALLSPLGRCYHLPGAATAIASRAQLRLSPLGRSYGYRLSGAATAIVSRARFAPRPPPCRARNAERLPGSSASTSRAHQLAPRGLSS
jgi:hypothetical protein